MYWAEAGARRLRRATLSGQDMEDVIVKATDDEAPYDVAVDPEGGKVYWTSKCCGVRRANLTGADEEPVALSPDAAGLALDPAAGLLFWTDRQSGELWSSSLNGSERKLIVGGLVEPLDVEIDSDAGHVYWLDAGRQLIERSRLDGRGREAINASWTTVMPHGIALDKAARKVYVTDYENGPSGGMARIFRARANGDDSEILIQEDSMLKPFGLAIDEVAGAVLWTDSGAGRIQSLTLRCPAGNISVPSSTNSTMVLVPYETMEHQGLQEADCPSGGYRGTVKLTCNDGSIAVSSGQCAKHCSRGTYEEAGHPPIIHGRIRDGMQGGGNCPRGFIGPVLLKCEDGKVDRYSGSCKQPSRCPEGRFLVSHAAVQHPDLDSSGRWGGDCPPGFNGSFMLHCLDGEVSLLSGACQASCQGSGSLWVDEGRVEISHTGFREGSELRVHCPAESAGPGVKLVCTGGTLRVASGSCSKSPDASRSDQCVAGHKSISGVEVVHGAIDDGETVAVLCPSGYTGGVNLTCSGGSVVPETGSACYAHCPNGLVNLGSGALVRHGASIHGEYTTAPCPSGFTGSIRLLCSDGNTSAVDCPDAECSCRSTEATVPSGGGILVPTLTVPFFAVLCLIGGMSVYHWCCKGRGAHSRAGGGDAGGSEASCGGGEDGGINEIVVEFPTPLPLYWATKEGVHIFPDPNRIDEIQRLMTETWRVCYTRDRKLIAGAHKVPSGCRVANVLRIENRTAYDRYWQRKALVAESRSEGCEPFSTQTKNRLNRLDCSLNETYLFHGTNPEAAHAIAKDLFRIDKAGSCGGMMFGPGIYLAENASKSDEYAKEGQGVYVGLCAMLVCRAMMGRVLTVSGAGDYSGRALSGEYDSLCGDRLAAAGTFREMVFFHEDSVYAEFIVIYARIYGDD